MYRHYLHAIFIRSLPKAQECKAESANAIQKRKMLQQEVVQLDKGSASVLHFHTRFVATTDLSVTAHSALLSAYKSIVATGKMANQSPKFHIEEERQKLMGRQVHGQGKGVGCGLICGGEMGTNGLFFWC